MKTIHNKILFLLCVFLLAASVLLYKPALAQGSDITTLRVTLLDETDTPIVDAEITLILVRYSDAGIEQIPSGTCRTDEDGQCTFEIVDAPRLASGQAEAYLDVTGIARQLVSWAGNELNVVLKQGELTLAATINAPLETGYDYTPDANEVLTATLETQTPTETLPATSTVSPTSTIRPSDTPIPSPTASETLLPPTAMPTPGPRSGQPGILPLACGVIVFTVFALLAGRKLWRNR